MIEPGETWSLWRAAGRPTMKRGYMEAAALRNGRLTWDVGGAICLVSTVVYNAALLSGATVVERRPHSVDSYGPDRYFELGRDATIEYGYIDLRFRNDGPAAIRLHVDADDVGVQASMWATEPVPATWKLEVTLLAAANGEIRVRTDRRLVRSDGVVLRREDLGISSYRSAAEGLDGGGPSGGGGRRASG
ncbi:MAG: VanW family protein [Dehalococcoidia bacterium]